MKVDISTIAVTKGRMPGNIERRWAREHEVELMAAWDRVRDGLGFHRLGGGKGMGA